MKITRVLTVALLSTAVFGCAKNGPDYIAGFDPPATADGFTRYVTPAVEDIAPGANVEYCQWVAPAADEDQDVLDFSGMQSATGHHATLYATSETNFPVGESHICTNADMLSISFVGAIGGEGTAAAASKLPDGLYFRLRKGQALMANTHWLNATDKTVEGQAVLDVKYTPAEDSHIVADNFANNADTFSIPPAAPYTFDVSCVMQQNMNFAMVADHMHSNGTAAYTELIHPDGTKDMLIDDTTWPSDAQFNPQFTFYSLANPKVVQAGDTIHTHCEWQNQTQNTLMFPDEMCVGTGFYFPGTGAVYCDDGTWPTN